MLNFAGKKLLADEPTFVSDDSVDLSDRIEEVFGEDGIGGEDIEIMRSMDSAGGRSVCTVRGLSSIGVIRGAIKEFLWLRLSDKEPILRRSDNELDLKDEAMIVPLPPLELAKLANDCRLTSFLSPVARGRANVSRSKASASALVKGSFSNVSLTGVA